MKHPCYPHFERDSETLSGYWFLDDANVSAKKWTPPPGLTEFMETARKAKRKLVYIGFGSIVVSDPKAMTRIVVDAILRSGVYAILSKGWSDRLVKTAADLTEVADPLPKEIYPISSIPHDWLFKRVDAACHHGGAGTTGASLRGKIRLSITQVTTSLKISMFQLVFQPSLSHFLATNSFGLTE